jgi:hypothetical protein
MEINGCRLKFNMTHEEPGRVENKGELQRMGKRRIFSGFGSLFLAAVLSGCLSFGGGDETTLHTKTTTLGQELQDLQNARDKGIISENEYKEQREKLLRGKND